MAKIAPPPRLMLPKDLKNLKTDIRRIAGQSTTPYLGVNVATDDTGTTTSSTSWTSWASSPTCSTRIGASGIAIVWVGAEVFLPGPYTSCGSSVNGHTLSWAQSNTVNGHTGAMEVASLAGFAVGGGRGTIDTSTGGPHLFYWTGTMTYSGADYLTGCVFGAPVTDQLITGGGVYGDEGGYCNIEARLGVAVDGTLSPTPIVSTYGLDTTTSPVTVGVIQGLSPGSHTFSIQVEVSNGAGLNSVDITVDSAYIQVQPL